MALRDCPECSKPVSSSAVACPHCGHPLQQRPTKRGRGRELLLVLAVVVVFAMFVGREEPGSKKQTAAVAHCDAVDANKLVQQALDGGILHRVTWRSDVARVYVREPWAGLTINEKKALDVILKCTASPDTPREDAIVVYHDSKSGKELATSNRYAFTMD